MLPIFVHMLPIFVQTQKNSFSTNNKKTARKPSPNQHLISSLEPKNVTFLHQYCNRILL